MCGEPGSSAAMSLVVYRRHRIAAECGALDRLSVNEQAIRLDGSSHRRIRRAHDSASIRMARPPRRKRSSHLPRHRPAHRRIDFQKYAIDAGVHQRGHRIGCQCFSGVVAERAAVGCDGNDERVGRVRLKPDAPVSGRRGVSDRNVHHPRFANWTDASPAPVRSSATSPSTSTSS